MSYTAQDLNTKIALQRNEGVPDGVGQVIDRWVTYTEAFARFEPLLGREFFQAAMTVSEAQAKLTMRWRDDIQPSDRIVARGESWSIVSIQNIAYRNRELLIYVKRNRVADE